MGIKKGSFIQDGNNRVGPGQYESKSTVETHGFSKAHNKGFGSSGHIQEKKSKDRVPGPGQYSHNSTSEYSYNAVKFGTSVRKNQDNSNSLGPGQYLSINDNSD